MARVHAVASVTTRSDTPPAYGPGTFFPFSPINRLTAGGRKEWDVFAALVGRVTKWRATGSAAISGTDTDAKTFTGTLGINIGLDCTANVLGTSPIPEKLFAVPFTGLAGASAQEDGLGTWSESNDPEPFTGTYLMQMAGEWKVPDSITVGEYGFPYFTFGFFADKESAGAGIAMHFLSCTTYATGEVDTVGSVTVRIPDWMGGSGYVELSAPLLSSPAGPGQTRDVSVNIELTPEECLPYGLNPSDPNEYTTADRIWNDNGSANMDPLTAPHS